MTQLDSQPEVMGALPREATKAPSVPSPCGQQGCTGHLGKFPDCLTEALWEISMFDGESTGSTEAYGHYTLLSFDVPTRHAIGYDLGVPESEQGPVVEIPASWYMVQATESGAVYSWACESESVARQQFTEFEHEYGAWSEINDPEYLPDDEVPPNAGSAE